MRSAPLKCLDMGLPTDPSNRVEAQMTRKVAQLPPVCSFRARPRPSIESSSFAPDLPPSNRLRLCEHLATCEPCRPCLRGTLTCHAKLATKSPSVTSFLLSDARSTPAAPHLSLSRTDGTRGQVLLSIDPDGMVAARRRLDATPFCIQCSTCPSALLHV